MQKPESKLPEPGEVLNYSYLWERECRQDHDEGMKDRPIAVVMLTHHVDGFDLVHVVPLITSPPLPNQQEIEVPEAVRRQIGLSPEKAWIIISE